MQGKSDIKSLIADHMEGGFLENIIDMFRQDKSLYPLIGELMTDERVRVRLGVSALVETLAAEDDPDIPNAVPGIMPLLKNPDPVVRGDAAYLLGLIGSDEAVPSLKKILDDDNREVREIAGEAIEEIRKNRL